MTSGWFDVDVLASPVGVTESSRVGWPGDILGVGLRLVKGGVEMFNLFLSIYNGFFINLRRVFFCGSLC